MPACLTTADQIQCPHGGIATLMTSNQFVSVQASRKVLLESDVHVVAGCAFTIGPKPSPCLRIEWTGGASSVSIAGVKVLLASSIGKCINAENAPQGVALISGTQQKVTAI